MIRNYVVVSVVCSRHWTWLFFLGFLWANRLTRLDLFLPFNVNVPRQGCKTIVMEREVLNLAPGFGLGLGQNSRVCGHRSLGPFRNVPSQLVVASVSSLFAGFSLVWFGFLADSFGWTQLLTNRSPAGSQSSLSACVSVNITICHYSSCHHPHLSLHKSVKLEPPLEMKKIHDMQGSNALKHSSWCSCSLLWSACSQRNITTLKNLISETGGSKSRMI